MDFKGPSSTCWLAVFCRAHAANLRAAVLEYWIVRQLLAETLDVVASEFPFEISCLHTVKAAPMLRR